MRNALFEAVLGTGLILLLFLHTWRSTLIVMVSIPVSVLSTLALMAVLHYNLNLLTMVALVVSVGILVDDSIVVLENIYRHLTMGKTPVHAAIDGRSEIGLAAVTITLVDVVVYVPIAVLTTGLPQQFLAPFAVVITAATLSSLLVSFTLTPLLARLFLQPTDATAGTSLWARFGRAWDRGFDRLEHGYEAVLRWSLPRRWLVIALGLASFVAGISLFALGYIGLDFFPNGDQSEVDLTVTMPSATSLDATNLVAQDVERRLHEEPEVRSLYTVVGQAPGNGAGFSLGGSNQAQITVLLVSRADRTRSAADIAEDIRTSLEGQYPGAKIQVGMPNAFGFGGFAGAPIQVQIQGTDPQTVDRLSRDVQAAIASVPGAVDLDNSDDNVQPQLRAKIDWTRAADLGVSARDAGSALRAALDGFTSNGNQFRQTGYERDPDPHPDRQRQPDHAGRRAPTADLNQQRRGGGAWPVHDPDSGEHPDQHRPRQPLAQRHDRRQCGRRLPGRRPAEFRAAGSVERAAPAGLQRHLCRQWVHRRQRFRRPRPGDGRGRAAHVHAHDDAVRVAHPAVGGAHVAAAGARRRTGCAGAHPQRFHAVLHARRGRPARARRQERDPAGRSDRSPAAEGAGAQRGAARGRPEPAAADHHDHALGHGGAACRSRAGSKKGPSCSRAWPWC